MGKILDITDQKYGRLIAVKCSHIKNGIRYWFFKCECGTVKPINMGSVRSGAVRSCGCLHMERCKSGDNGRRHGYTGTRVHDLWRDMLKRCNNHPDYNGRGIKVCKSWLVFENFLSDMGEPKKGLTLDRINNDGDYKPSNCRWATRRQQAQNRRTSRLLTYQGQTLCLTEWARRLGIKQPTLHYRLKQGWSVKKALST